MIAAKVDRVGYYLASVVIVFLAGVMIGRGSMRAPKLEPKAEQIIDAGGSRVIKREVMQAEPAPIFRGGGEVQSDTRVIVRSVMHPEEITEIHLQEVETAEGPRMVVEAPAGFQVIRAEEIRRDRSEPSLRSPYSVGIAGKAGKDGAALGIGGAFQRGAWTITGQGFKDSVGLSVLFRF